jgi:hypothetical protein
MNIGCPDPYDLDTHIPQRMHARFPWCHCANQNEVIGFKLRASFGIKCYASAYPVTIAAFPSSDHRPVFMFAYL